MVSQFYPPVVGGQEQHVRNLSTALVSRGHEVIVATIQLGGDEMCTDDDGVTVRRVRMSAQRVNPLFTSSRQFAPPIPDPEAMIAIRRIVTHEKPDVIHAHDWLARSVMPRPTRERCPLVMTLHDYSLVCGQKRLVNRGQPCSGPGVRKCLICTSSYYGPIKGPSVAVGNWIASRGEQRAVRMYLPVSRAVAAGNELERHGLPFRVIPNFVPDDVAEMPDGQWPPELPQEGFLLFVGDITPDKGAEILLEAYRKVPDPPPLVLIGRRYLPLEDLPRGVVVAGVLQRASVMAAWRRCLLGIVPSIVPDSCPTVVIEAMAAGRPVIGTRTGGIPDLIDDGRTGILAPHGDPEALALAMRRLLASADLRRRMSEAARSKFSEFTTGSVVPRIEEAYQSVLVR
jgi:glycosyltransferase involved in cell wall biosynthesis